MYNDARLLINQFADDSSFQKNTHIVNRQTHGEWCWKTDRWLWRTFDSIWHTILWQETKGLNAWRLNGLQGNLINSTSWALWSRWWFVVHSSACSIPKNWNMCVLDTVSSLVPSLRNNYSTAKHNIENTQGRAIIFIYWCRYGLLMTYESALAIVISAGILFLRRRIVSNYITRDGHRTRSKIIKRYAFVI